MHIDLALVERGEHIGTLVAEANLAQQQVGGRIDDRYRVGVLVGGVDAIFRTRLSQCEIGAQCERQDEGKFLHGRYSLKRLWEFHG